MEKIHLLKNKKVIDNFIKVIGFCAIVFSFSCGLFPKGETNDSVKVDLKVSNIQIDTSESLDIFDTPLFLIEDAVFKIIKNDSILENELFNHPIGLTLICDTIDGTIKDVYHRSVNYQVDNIHKIIDYFMMFEKINPASYPKAERIKIDEYTILIWYVQDEFSVEVYYGKPNPYYLKN